MPKIDVIGHDQSITRFNKSDKKGELVVESRPIGRGEMEVRQPSEIGDAMREINDDTIDTDTGMSGIDMKANLHYTEVGATLALDSLVRFHVLPTKCLVISRQKKRLSVSQGGRGRDDLVNIVGRKQEQEARTGGASLGERFKAMFTQGQQPR